MGFVSDDSNVLDDWLTVGPAASLRGTSRERPVHTTLFGARIALWRDDAQQPRALLDEAGAAPLAVQERYGYLWVCPRQPKRPLFAFPEFDQPGRRIVDCGGIGVASSGLRVIENFLDMGHFPYVHAGVLGQVPHTEVKPYKVEVSADTDEIMAVDCLFWQPQASASAAGGIETRYVYRVMQPLSAMLYKSCPQREGELDAIGLFVQPLDDEHCIAYCLLAYYEDTLADRDLIAFQQMIFGQDKPILENHVPRRLPIEGRLETPTRADVTSATYRRWLKRRGMRFGVEPAR